MPDRWEEGNEEKKGRAPTCDGGSAMRTREVQIRASDPVISRAPQARLM